MTAPSSSDSEPAASSRQPFAPTGLVATCLALLVGGVLAWHGFGASADWRIDYGRELYVPWRLVDGEALTRDLAYFNGPLSPYWNALWFLVFGVSIRVQAIANLLVIAATTVVIWTLGRRLGGRWTALAAAVGWLPMLAFQHQGDLGNFNWLAPYSHEMPHGIALALATMLGFARYLERPSAGRAALVGLGAGLVALTKPEITLATGAGLAVGIGGLWWTSRGGPADPTSGDPTSADPTPGDPTSADPTPGEHVPQARSHGRHLLLGSAALVGAIGVATLLLAFQLGFGDALRTVAGGWRFVFQDELRQLKFYRTTMGTYDFGNSLFGIGLWTGIWLYSLSLFGLLAAVAGRGATARRTPLRVALTALCALPLLLRPVVRDAGFGLTLFDDAPALLIAIAALGWLRLPSRVLVGVVAALPIALLLGQAAPANPLAELLGRGLNWDLGFRPLPVFVALAVLRGATSLWRPEPNAPATDSAGRVFSVAFSAFALAMLLKILFAVQVREYGFGLAVPAVLVAIAGLVRGAPRLATRYAAEPTVLRAAGLGFVTLAAFGVGVMSWQARAKRTERIEAAAPGDALWQRAFVGSDVQVLDPLVRQVGPDETLAVVPEGITFNYRWRRVNSTGHLNLMPPELLMFGEDAIIQDFESKPPDAILVIHRLTAEYGLPMFSVHYGEKLARWMAAHYETVAQVGAVPFRKLDQGGAILMRRKDRTK